jgi:hypothetical protein
VLYGSSKVLTPNLRRGSAMLVMIPSISEICPRWPRDRADKGAVDLAAS